MHGHSMPTPRLSVNRNLVRFAAKLTKNAQPIVLEVPVKRTERRLYAQVTSSKPTSRELRGSPTAKHQCNPIPAFA